MYEGRFDLQLRGAKGLTDRDFEKAQQDGYIMDLLNDLPLEKVLTTKNMIFHWLSVYLHYKLMQGGSPGSPWSKTDGGPEAYFAFVLLMDTDGEPAYYGENAWYYDSYSYQSIHSQPGTVDGSAGAKRFEEDQISDWAIWEDTGGREAIYFRNRWLYTPTQANSSTIRSLGIYFFSNGDDTYRDYYEAIARGGRVRLKDTGGNPVTLSKNSNQVLLVEYTFSFVSM